MKNALTSPILGLIVAGLLTSASAFGQTGAERLDNPVGQGTPAVEGGSCTTSGGATGVELVVDGGFEAGTPNPNWDEASSNFGSPICDEAGCGLGGGTGPFAGTFWTWFGGIAAPEVGSVSQSVTIPPGTAELNFQLEVPTCDGAASDFMQVLIDGTQVFETTCGDGLINPYELQTIDASTFADGGTYDLEFNSTIDGSAISNFFIDDVSLCSVEGDDGPEPPPETTAVPTMGKIGIGVLLLALLGFGLVMVRRNG